MGQCKAAVTVAGAHYVCEMEGPHPGWAHMSEAAQAVWCSDDEAREFGDGEFLTDEEEDDDA